MATGDKFLLFKNFTTPKQAGDYHRLLCLSGEQKGDAFFLLADRLVIGRGNEAEIKIKDTNLSREHAELKKINGKYVITDMKSQNGVILNDLKITQETLRDGDKIVIGKTVFKYSLVKVDSNQSTSNADKGMDSAGAIPLPEGESGALEISNNVNIHSSFEDGRVKGGANVGINKSTMGNKFNQIGNGKKKISKILIIGVLAVVAFYLLIDDKPKGKDQQLKDNYKKGQDISREINAILQKKKQQEDKELEKNLNRIFHDGLREASEGNYFRAINEFQLALILSPQNGRAAYYLGKVKGQLDAEIERYIASGARMTEALRYEAAVVEYCRIIRLLQDYPDDSRYKDADTNIKNIEKLTGKEEGEIKCLSR